MANTDGVGGEGRDSGESTTTPTKQHERGDIHYTIETLKNILNKAETIQKEGEEAAVVVKRREIQDLLNALETRQNATKKPEEDTILGRILANTEEIRKNTNKTMTKTYSQAAATNIAQAAFPAKTQMQQSEDCRKEKQLLVRIRNEKEREGFRARKPEEVIHKIRLSEPKALTAHVITARTLRSGDVQIATTGVEVRQKLEKEQSWLKEIAPSAEVVVASYPVRVHGIKVTRVDISDQKRIIADITKQNERLHNNLQITKIAWPKSALQGKLAYASLLVNAASAEEADRIITEGLVIDHEMKICDRFIPKARVTQCYKCFQYGHLAYMCPNAAVCGNCSGQHTTKECERTHKATKCALCRGDHTVWSYECPQRQKEVRRVQTVLQTTPTLYSHTPSATTQLDSRQTTATQRGSTSSIPVKSGRPNSTQQLQRAAHLPGQTLLNGKRKATPTALEGETSSQREKLNPRESLRNDPDEDSESITL